MTIRLNPRWLLVSILFFTLQFCRAQIVVPPTLSFDLGPDVAEESQLWDLNGSYVVNTLVTGNKGLAEPVQIAFTLIQSPSGKLTTTTNELVNASVVFNNDDNSAFVAQAQIKGKVTGFAGTARVHFTVRFVGNGSLGGQATTCNGSFTVDAETDPSTGQLTGTKLSKFSAVFPNLSAIKGKAEFGTDLPPGSDGSWNLTMHLVGINKLTGTGIVSTSSEALGLDLTGKFNGLFVTKAKGSASVPNTVSGVGCSGTILVPSTFDTVQFNGKLLGQKMSFNVTTPSPE
jgi:hypothetical protein